MKITKSQLQQVIREALEEEMDMYDDVEMDKDKQVSPSPQERLEDLDMELEELSGILGDDLIMVLQKHLDRLRA